MLNLFLVCRYIEGKMYPIIAFDKMEFAQIYIKERENNISQYIIEVIDFEPSY